VSQRSIGWSDAVFALFRVIFDFAEATGNLVKMNINCTKANATRAERAIQTDQSKDIAEIRLS